jgi:5'-3' exonuclease
MIILDLNQVMIANIMALYGKHLGKTPIDTDLFRATTLNTIRAIYKKFKEEYGELVIAADGKRSWRKEIFPFYKANRKKNRESSDIDWSSIFTNLNTIRQELKDNFPYRVIHIDTAEADDVIGTLVIELSSRILPQKEKILILSGDKDFVQLQMFNSSVEVKQYDPINKKYIESSDPKSFMKEHIIRGDVGDGIPNFLSPDNTFVEGFRQKAITKKNVDEWLQRSWEEICNDEEKKRNYKRNEVLIDLRFIPENIKQKIIHEYESQSEKDRSKIFNYFIKNKLKVLMESINDF